MRLNLIPTMELLSHEKKQRFIVLSIRHRWLWMQRDCEYFGSGTVWRRVSTFRRCDTFLESTLANFYRGLQFEGKI